MTLKQIDNKEDEIQLLSSLYNKSSSKKQKKLIFEEIQKVKSGYEAEKENAFYLDARLCDNKNLLLLNDIRIEHDGEVAQIDHIIITRFGIELLESKSSTGVMTINNDGSISIKHGSKTSTLPNPLEQSYRHARILEKFLQSENLLSSRIKMLGGIFIDNKILINPKTTLTNSSLPDGFFRADSFITMRNKEIDNIGIIKSLKLISTAYPIDMAYDIANAIIKAHSPIKHDYRKKFRVEGETNSEKSNNKEKADGQDNIENETICPRCKKGKLVKRVTKKRSAQEKYGKDEFYGCSRYPKCRYTQK